MNPGFKGAPSGTAWTGAPVTWKEMGANMSWKNRRGRVVGWITTEFGYLSNVGKLIICAVSINCSVEKVSYFVAIDVV